MTRPSDVDIAQLHFVRNMSIKDIAHKKGINESSVRASISRALADMQVVVDLLRQLPAALAPSKEVMKQERIIEESKLALATKVASLDTIKILFLTDIHYPYTDFEALNKAYKITKDFNPDFITVLSDFFDFEQYSNWDKKPTPASLMWGSDINNSLKAMFIHHQALKNAAPNATLLALNGNHDNWMFNYLRTNPNGWTETNITLFMEKLKAQGVLVFSRGFNEPIIPIRNVRLVHGVSSSINDTSVGRATIEMCREGNTTYHTVSGHVHRHFTIKYAGVTHYNVGKLCINDMGYIKHKAHWTTSVGLITITRDNKVSVVIEEL